MHFSLSRLAPVACPRWALIGALLLVTISGSAPEGSAAEPAAAVSAPPEAATPLFFTGRPDASSFRALCEAELQSAKLSLDQMLDVKGKRTLENTLVPYNLVMLHSDNAGYYSSLMESVHPDSAFRAGAETLTQAATKFQDELKLNRGVYDALQAVDVSKEDATTRYFVSKTLRDFRLAGVDKDEATRKRIEALREELVLTSQDFDRNIRNDSRTIQVTAAELDGMPEDYMKGHPAGPDGKITISIEYPDRIPVMAYCKNGETRRRIQTESLNRAYPANMAVLDSLVAKRDRLAKILGYPNWADFITADKMIGDGKHAGEFIDRVGELDPGASQTGVPGLSQAQAGGRSQRHGGEPVGRALLRAVDPQARF